jgi:2-polyprenyl-3-methyl-5-hydroxy-6-metoxy-1,4-benzoquinol methylase
MAEPELSYADWPRLRTPIADWDGIYAQGAWFDWPAEVPHHAIIAGFAARLVGRGTLLDAGCGDGGLIEYLDLSRFEYFGFDGSGAAIERARERPGRPNVVHRTFDQFEPASGHTFDVVVFNESLQFAADPFGIVDRFRSFLSARGVIVVSLFQAKDGPANGVLLARLLQQECATGRFSLLELAEGRNLLRDLTWRIFALK